jgi:hypothetical protein
MRVPEFRRQQWAERDRQQDADKRQRPGNAHRRAAEVGGIGWRRQQRCDADYGE